MIVSMVVDVHEVSWNEDALGCNWVVSLHRQSGGVRLVLAAFAMRAEAESFGRGIAAETGWEVKLPPKPVGTRERLARGLQEIAKAELRQMAVDVPRNGGGGPEGGPRGCKTSRAARRDLVAGGRRDGV